jgi:hypothetical protein
MLRAALIDVLPRAEWKLPVIGRPQGNGARHRLQVVPSATTGAVVDDQVGVTVADVVPQVVAVASGCGCGCGGDDQVCVGKRVKLRRAVVTVASGCGCGQVSLRKRVKHTKSMTDKASHSFIATERSA